MGQSLLLIFIFIVVISSVSQSKPTTRKPSASPRSRPHIVLLLASEWGWNNVGFHGNNAEIKTPFIDSLAKNNVIMNRFYNFNNCGPSRQAILSGRYPAHVSLDVGQQQGDPHRYNPADPISGYAGLTLGMTSLGEKLKELGYRGVFTGKWESGFATKAHLPASRGFDRFLGVFDDTVDMYDQTYKGNTLRDSIVKSTFYDSDLPPVKITQNFNVYIQGDTIQDPASQKNSDICMHTVRNYWEDLGPAYRYASTGFLEDSWTTFTLERIYEHDVTIPLFVFHSFMLPHVPYQIPIAYQQPFVNVTNPNRRKINAMIWYMDLAVSQIVRALEVKGMYENSLIVMTSDHGGFLKYRAAGNNYPLRGGKTSWFDGGIRVNTIFAGGIIPNKMKGTILDGYMHGADLYPTLLDFAGGNQAFLYSDAKAAKYGLPAIDGISLKSYIIGKSVSSPRNEIFISPQVLIQGQYKIITGVVAHSIWTSPIWPTQSSLQPDPVVGLNSNSTYNSTFGVVNCGTKGCLFDILNDPTEKTDLSKDLPDVRNSLLERLAYLNTTIWAPNRGPPSPLSCTVAVTQYGGFYGPFVPSPNITL